MSGPDIPGARRPWRRGGSGRQARRRWEADRARISLAEGEAVVLAGRARRTTPRGWGTWVDGRLHLPGPEGGRAEFLVDDPSEVALVTRHGEAPVSLDPPLDVSVRPVRYKAEAFPGMAADIIVATSPQRVVEIALPPDQVELAARRLSELR